MDLLGRIKAWLTPTPMAQDNGYEFWLEEMKQDRRDKPVWCAVHHEPIAPGVHDGCAEADGWIWRPRWGWVRRDEGCWKHSSFGDDYCGLHPDQDWPCKFRVSA